MNFFNHFRIFSIISLILISGNIKYLFADESNPAQEITSKEGGKTPAYTLSMAFYYYNNYDYDKAIQYFEKYIEMTGEEVVSLTHLGKIYLNLKNNEKAMSYFQRALRLDPKNIDTLTSLADIYLNAKDQTNAIAVLESIVELDPVNERSLFTLAEIFQTKKDQRRSMVYYKKLSLATLKNSANLRLLNKSYTQIARYYYDNQDYENALEYYEKIVEINPEDYNSLYVYAELLKINGKFSQSAVIMMQLLKKDPVNQEVLESLIESLFILDDYQTRSILKSYMEITQNVNALFRGIHNIYMGDYKTANTDFSRVLIKNPNRISAHMGLLKSIPSENLEERKKEAYTVVILAQKVKSFDLARKYMDLVFQILEQENKVVHFQEKINNIDHDIQLNNNEEKLVNEFIDTYYTHAISLENLNHPKQALAYYAQCIRLINDQMSILKEKYKPEEYLHFESNLFTRENIGVKKSSNAESTLQKLKSLREKKYEALLNYNWLSNKNKESTLKNLRENIDIMDQDPRAYFMNGIITYEHGRESNDDKSQYNLAKDFFINAIGRFEKNSEKKTAPANYYFYLGITYDKLGDFNQMDAFLKKSIELDPYNSVYLNYLGYMYSLKNINLDQAFEYIKRGLEDDPENDAYLDTLGWIYFKMDKYEEALGQLLVARTLSDKKGRKDPVIDFHIAETYKKLNNHNQAVRFYKLSLENIQHSSEPLDKKFIEIQIHDLTTPASK